MKGMRVAFAAAAACLGFLAAPAAQADGGNYIKTPLGCQQITSLSSAAGFSSVPAGATLASIAVENEPVRYRDDGTAPTSSVGTLLPPGGPWPYTGSLSAIEFIQTAASATVDVCFYK